MKLVFASNNAHKIAEIQAMLPSPIELVGLQDIGCFEDIPETASTLEGNAKLKADYVTENYGLPCFADDTGLEVEALNGAPGVYSARYAGEQKNALDNMQKLLTALEGKSNRKAQFKTVIALNINGKSHQFTGIVKGEISKEKRNPRIWLRPNFCPRRLYWQLCRNESIRKSPTQSPRKSSGAANCIFDQ